MANDFSKEVRVMFDRVLEGFDDATVISGMATVTNTDGTTMERTGDTLWFPMPYIMASYDGNDASSNFKDVAQLSVPATLNNQKHVPWILTARELRDLQQQGRLVEAAKQKLASDINIDVMNKVSLLGSVVVARPNAATGFDDVAQADAAFTEQGIARDRRVMALSPRDYNNMAGNLAKPQTSGLDKTATAFEKARLGDVAGFETYKMDYAYRLPAATATGVTITNTQPLSYVPKATDDFPGQGKLNVDNRFQTISVNVTSGALQVGDCFTIADVNSVHHIAKVDTGQPKTFRVVKVNSATEVVITPPIIAPDAANPSTLQYKNVTAAPANGAAITLLNIKAASVNPFWQGDAVQILPGRLEPARDSGLSVMYGTTDRGFGLLMTRQGAIDDLNTKYRIDAFWGSFVANTEMAGIEIFGQS